MHIDNAYEEKGVVIYKPLENMLLQILDYLIGPCNFVIKHTCFCVDQLDFICADKGIKSPLNVITSTVFCS
jgi:hypothetical protein